VVGGPSEPRTDTLERSLDFGRHLYNLILQLVVLAPLTGSRADGSSQRVCLVQYGLTHIQLRLGLGSNDDVGLLAYHIPMVY
jgi:hypothetical protein